MNFLSEMFPAKSATTTVFHDVNTPTTGFTTTTVSRAKEELGPGWAMDDVYPPLADLRWALLTDEAWAAMSSWEKDVWEMFYRPDWERLACIEQILEDTPAAQRAQVHEEIREALRSLGASASKPALAAAATCYIDASHAVLVSAMSSTIVKEGSEDILSVSTGFVTTAAATCSTVCLPRHPVAAPVLDECSPPTPAEYVQDTNDDTSSPDTNGCVTEVPAPECSIPDQETLLASMGGPTAELLRRVVLEPIPMSAALQGSSSLVSIVEETLGVDPLASIGFITTVPSTCLLAARWQRSGFLT